MKTKLSNIVEPTIDARADWLARVSEAAHALATTHVQEQLGGDTSRSSLPIGATNRVPLVSERDRWLDPPPARSWQLRSESTLAVIGALIGLSAVAMTDVTPIGQFPLPDFWRQLAIDRSALASWSAPQAPAASPMQSEPATARLIVQSSREMSGKPVRLALALQGQSEGAVVTITGLVPGMELSNGDPIGAAAWRLTATDLDDIWIGPPDGFVGSIDLVAELRLPEDEVVDRQTVRLEWLPSI
jgi:hypothetical protein